MLEPALCWIKIPIDVNIKNGSRVLHRDPTSLEWIWNIIGALQINCIRVSFSCQLEIWPWWSVEEKPCLVYVQLGHRGWQNFSRSFLRGRTSPEGSGLQSSSRLNLDWFQCIKMVYPACTKKAFRELLGCVSLQHFPCHLCFFRVTYNIRYMTDLLWIGGWFSDIGSRTSDPTAVRQPSPKKAAAETPLHCTNERLNYNTCNRKAISITKLFRYPRTRLTTPLATVEDPTSTSSWMNVQRLHQYQIYAKEPRDINIYMLLLLNEFSWRVYLQVVLPTEIIYFERLAN